MKLHEILRWKVQEFYIDGTEEMADLFPKSAKFIYPTKKLILQTDDNFFYHQNNKSATENEVCINHYHTLQLQQLQFTIHELLPFLPCFSNLSYCC